MDLSIVILSYNVKSFLEQALRTIMDAAEGLEIEVFVVDNASSDESPEMVRALFPNVHLICNDRNLGFAKGNNQALRLCKGRYCLLINADTVVHRNTLRTMVAFLDAHPEAGAAGCKILNPDGMLEPACRRGFPTPMVAFYKVVGLSTLFPRSPRFGRYNLTYLSPEEIHEVDALSGSFMMVRRAAIGQVGLLDETFFFYGEDLDWCYRIKQAGWKIYYVPTTEIIHFRGESSKTVSKTRLLIRFYHAMYIFVRKHFHGKYYLFPVWLLTSGIVLRGLLSFVVNLLRRFALPLVDSVLVLGGLGLGLAVRYYGPAVMPKYTPLEWVGVYTTCWAMWMISFVLLGLYGPQKHSPLRALAGVFLGWAGIGLSGFFFKDYNFTRLGAIYSLVFSSFLVAGWRAVFRFLARTEVGHRIGRRRVLIVGATEEGVAFLRVLKRHPHLEYEVVGFVDPRSEMRGAVVEGKRVVGVVNDLPALVREYGIDDVLVTTAMVSYAQMLGLSTRIGWPNLQFKLVPTAFSSMVNGQKVETVDDLPLVDIAYRPRRGWMALWKAAGGRRAE